MKASTAAPLLVIVLIGALAPRTARSCELFGFSFNKPVRANHLLVAFRRRSENNPDGWGVAFYRNKAAQIFKEPGSAVESDLMDFLVGCRHIKPSLLIAHVRRATVGGVEYQNTHPFARELNGREYVLAHNGTLVDFRKRLPLGRIQPLGVNDSEFLLCCILGRIEEQKITQWNEAGFEWLEKTLHEINEAGSINCLFSDGQYLFAYHDKNGAGTLHHVKRQAPFRTTRFPDIRKDIDLPSIYPPSVKGVLVATKPLTDEPWEAFKPGQLIVLRNGTPVFTGAPMR